MKKVSKFIVCPCSLYDTPDLSLSAKWCLLAIDSITPQGGWVSVGVQALSSLTNLSNKEVKSALQELHEHGAIEVKLSEDGQKVMKPLLYKDAYPKIGEKPILGDKPTDSDPIDYAYIQEKWNEICYMLSKIDKFTPRRKQKTRACLKGAGATAEDLIKTFRLIATSSFLNGSKTDEWRCSFDWVIKSPDNYQKVIEGQYHKDYNERRNYEAIMRGEDVSHKKNLEEDFYK